MVDIKFTDGTSGEFDRKLVNSTKIIKTKKVTSNVIWSNEELSFLCKFWSEKGSGILMKSDDFQKLFTDIKNINTVFKVKVKTPLQIHNKLKEFNELASNYNDVIQNNTPEFKVLKSFNLNKQEYIEMCKNISHVLKNFQKLNLNLHEINYEAEEVKILTALHHYKEKDTKIIEAKKSLF